MKGGCDRPPFELILVAGRIGNSVAMVTVTRSRGRRMWECYYSVYFCISKGIIVIIIIIIIIIIVIAIIIATPVLLSHPPLRKCLTSPFHVLFAEPLLLGTLQCRS
jgi:hypothetical protein